MSHHRKQTIRINFTHIMGICLSCCGSDDDQESISRRFNERAPLLQDPTAVLQQPRPEPNPEDEQREQEFLAKIVERTSENLIDIKATFEQSKTNGIIDQAQKSAQFNYLLERLQNTWATAASDTHSDTPRRQAESLKPFTLKPVDDIVVKLVWD